jgi:hypothetical protein
MEFVPIPSHPDYSISRDGRVLHRGVRELKIGIHTIRYKRFSVVKDGKQVGLSVHRVLAEVFLGLDPSSKMEVNHINGDKLDNRLENLQVLTRLEHNRITTRSAKYPGETDELKMCRRCMTLAPRTLFRNTGNKSWCPPCITEANRISQAKFRNSRK